MFDYFHYFANKGNHPDKQEVLALEKTYDLASFSQRDASRLAALIFEAAKQYEKPVGVRIIMDGETLFEQLQGDLGADSLAWLTRKERVVKETEHSSYYIFLDNITSHAYDYMIDDERYGICGGSFPLVIEGHVRGTITCTNLRPEEDHGCVIASLEALYG